MAIEFNETPVPSSIPAMWAAIVRFVRSMMRSTVYIHKHDLEYVGLNTVNHGQRGQGVPRFAQPVVRGVGAASVNVVEMTPTQLVLWASAPCTVDIRVDF